MDVDMRVIFLTTKMQKCINWYLTSCWKLPELRSQFLMLTGMMAKNRSLENLRGITKFVQDLNGLYFRGIDDAFALFSLSYCLNKMRVSWQCSWDYCQCCICVLSSWQNCSACVQSAWYVRFFLSIIGIFNNTIFRCFSRFVTFQPELKFIGDH